MDNDFELKLAGREKRSNKGATGPEWTDQTTGIERFTTLP
jgi:hypothetical protein